jgi:hypothetical protein
MEETPIKQGLSKEVVDSLMNQLDDTTPPTPPPPSAKEELEKAKRERTCPRCGWREDISIQDVLDEDKKEFLRSVLGNRPFTKEYKLFDGKLFVSFSSLNGKRSDAINRILDEALQLYGENPDKLFDIGLRVRTLFLLDHIKAETGFAYIPDKETTVLPSNLDEALAAFGKMTEDMHEPLIQAAVHSCLLFNALHRTLVKEGLDRNFWKGAGPV